MIELYARPRPYDVTDDRSLARVLAPLGAGGLRLVRSRRGDLHDGRARASTPDRQADRGRRRGAGRGRPSLPRRGPSLRRAGRYRADGRDPAQRVPVLHPQRGVPGHVPAAARPPTSTSGADGAKRSGRPSRTSSASRCVDLKPVGLAGSGGSTPLRLRVAGDPDTYLFGKLYAMNHVRADRWYKIGRTILYGRLEDEAPFQSVRRLVAVRGLHPPTDARRRSAVGAADGDRRAHPGARVPARHRVLRRREGDR